MVKFSPQRTLLALVGVALVLFLGLLLFRSEPRYGGHELSYWIGLLEWGSQAQQAESRAALRAMGKAAVPRLTQFVTAEDSAFKLKVLTYAPRYPVIDRFLKRNDEMKRALSIKALGIIGPPASNAIPALEQATKRRDWRSGNLALAALMKIRGQSIAGLIEKLDPDSFDWFTSMEILGEFGAEARAALPILFRGLNSTNHDVVATSVRALGEIHADPQTCVPALINTLRRYQTQKSVAVHELTYCLIALGQFEGDAAAAIPILRQFQNDPLPNARLFAMLSLSRILPREEGKAVLVQGLNDSNIRVSNYAGIFLNLMDPEAAVRTK